MPKTRSHRSEAFQLASTLWFRVANTRNLWHQRRIGREQMNEVAQQHQDTKCSDHGCSFVLLYLRWQSTEGAVIDPPSGKVRGPVGYVRWGQA